MRTSRARGVGLLATAIWPRALCKRASLVLLEHLHRAGVEEATLWHLGMPKEDSDFAPSDEHYVVVVDDEAIDPTARQFDKDGHAVTRQTLEVVMRPWHSAQEVRIGYVEPFIGRDLHEIPANWRSLADAEPPGDTIGWAYPGPWPTRGATMRQAHEPSSLPSSGMGEVEATHKLSLRGEAEARRAGGEILADGVALAHSDWVNVPRESSVEVDVDLIAEPGTYLARQTTNVGGNVYESVVTIDLGTIEHP